MQTPNQPFHAHPAQTKQHIIELVLLCQSVLANTGTMIQVPKNARNVVLLAKRALVLPQFAHLAIQANSNLVN